MHLLLEKLAKNFITKKLYLIININLRFEIFAIKKYFKVIIRLDDIF